MGIIPIAQAGLYRLGLRAGYWRWLTPAPKHIEWPDQLSIDLPIKIPVAGEILRLAGSQTAGLLKEADEICSGHIRLFGSETAALNLNTGHTLAHWTAYESGRAGWGNEDPKLVWEPARFGWAIILARAFLVSQNDDYAQIFWKLTEEFIHGNPPYLGPQWASGQEVAIRSMASSLAWKVFSDSPATTPQRTQLLAESLSAHAARIPPTLIYARSQNNNHLLVEAAGLYTCGILLKGLPQARDWQKTGWIIFNQALQKQIGRDGTYIQHSTNYHRLMLQTALWVHALATANGTPLPRSTLERLAAATHWLLEQVDPVSGQVPNLGHNDGAYILPLAGGGFSDYRPVTQAASRAFLGRSMLPVGPWDEMSLWFGLTEEKNHVLPVSNPVVELPDATYSASQARRPAPPIRGQEAWASLRAVKYSSRPGQCDQLHVELWVRGQNLAMDAGTYRYNAASPWENALSGTAAHNTVMVDGREQMTRAGRFLWLDWAQANYLQGDNLTAEHLGYARYGVRHRRSLSFLGANHWQVVDSLLPEGGRTEQHSAVLHWLLPDLPWDLTGTTLRLKTLGGIVRLRVALANETTAQTYIQLIRAGKVVAGPGTAPAILGWFSPTYNLKVPALSFRFFIEGVLPLSFTSDWFVL